jgi:hypothetical protein
VGAEDAFRNIVAAKKGTHPEFGLVHACEVEHAKDTEEIDKGHYSYLQSRITAKKLSMKKRDADIDLALLKALGSRLVTIRGSV